ncbi:MAG TPA: glycosyltransferase, partial [Candidatus Thermoplasmatota archaeon]|nr:glycosyltransferase [Candidatus Thermoplasmatota archaeon]
MNTLTSVLRLEWVLFIKPDEMPVVSSVNKLMKMLKETSTMGYGVYTRSTRIDNLIQNYQWVRKLDQFKDMGNSLYVHAIEPRLVRKNLAEVCLECLVNANMEKISWVCGTIVPSLVIEPILYEEPDSEESPRGHDLRCLKGELIYDITQKEDMVELSEMYTGFRLVHRGQFAGFTEGAKQGFGNLKMYIPMLDFLCKEGLFGKAKNLFETWIKHRPDDKEIYHAQIMGSFIYSNLLDIDKAIAWLEKTAEHEKSLLVLENLGKLYLLKGEKGRAVEYLNRLKDVRGNTFSKEILSAIDRDEWQPLRLSLCMIARNEETQIGKAMKSVDGIVDEIIVVDTGSSDRTKEIVKEFGGKVIETKWEDDFSKARNLGIREATCDYILVMDADEFISPGDRFALALFKKLLPTAKNIAFGIKVEPAKEAKNLAISYLDRLLKRDESVYQVRLFPRNSAIGFRGKVFEDLEEALINTGVNVRRNDMFRITNSMEGREWRDKRKIPAALKAFESIHDPQKALKGGLLFLRLGDFDGAFPWLIRVQEMNAELSSKIGLLYSRYDKLEMAEEILTKALKQFPKSAQLILSLSEVYHKQGKYDEVIKTLEKEIEVFNKEVKPEDEAAARYYLGIASIERGNITYGIEQLAIAHEKDLTNLRYEIAGIYAFSKVEQWEEALKVAAGIADEERIDLPDNVNDFIDVGLVFVKMSQHFVQTGKIEEANLCRKIVE